MPQPIVRFTPKLDYKNYLAMLEGSIGSTAFRHLYAEVDGVETDIVNDGLLSCALFASSILYHFGLIKSLHAQVSGLEKDLAQSGWERYAYPGRLRPVDLMLPGLPVIWEEADQASGLHGHCGFLMGLDWAISHSDHERAPVRHNPTFGMNDDGSPKRKIVAIYVNKFLEP